MYLVVRCYLFKEIMEVFVMVSGDLLMQEVESSKYVIASTEFFAFFIRSDQGNILI